MLIYLICAMNSPKGIINQIHKIMVMFFWGHIGGVKGKHLIVWDTMCLSESEGVVGFRSMHDVQMLYLLNYDGY